MSPKDTSIESSRYFSPDQGWAERTRPLSEIESRFQHEWEDFCYNLEQTLDIPGITVHIFNRVASEYEKLRDEWNLIIKTGLQEPNIDVNPKKKTALTTIKAALQQINQSYRAKKPSFINDIRQIIQSEKAIWPPNEGKAKKPGLFLVKK